MRRIAQCLVIALCALPILIALSIGYIMSVVINKEAIY